MEFSAQRICRMRSTMAYITLMLLMTGPVVGGLLNRRQADNTGKSTVIAMTAPPETSTGSGSTSASVSASGLASATSAASASVTDSQDMPVSASTTSSSTGATPTAATTTASAYNSTVTGNSTLDHSNDPSFCHVAYTPGVEPNPFCEPQTGTTFDVNASYKVSWDIQKFVEGSNITIELFNINGNSTTPTTPGGIELLSTQVETALGYTYINTTTAMLHGSTSNVTLVFFATSVKDGEPLQYPGPVVHLYDKTQPGDNSTTGGGSSDSSSSKQLGEKVGIPIGLILFLIILAALAFFFFRYRRNNSGYTTGKSLGQRTNTASLRGGGAGGAGGHRRQESFHDEPTSGGVELQDRNRGLTGEDNWDWGRDSTGSPVSPIGNQFRDELQRQKTGGRR